VYGVFDLAQSPLSYTLEGVAESGAIKVDVNLRGHQDLSILYDETYGGKVVSSEQNWESTISGGIEADFRWPAESTDIIVRWIPTHIVTKISHFQPRNGLNTRLARPISQYHASVFESMYWRSFCTFPQFARQYILFRKFRNG
jgi:hypothetical protein